MPAACALLVGAVALPTAVGVYGATVNASVHRTLDDQNHLLIGADVVIDLGGPAKVPASLQGKASLVLRRDHPTLNDTLVSVVGVFVNHPDPQNLEDFALSIGLHAVQLHGNETPDYCSMIQRVKVIKAFRVDATFRVDVLRNHGSGTFLLDSSSPAQFGGTGEVFNWSQAYGANAFGSIIIAGGLTPENVADAVRQVRPYAVDVSGGVEASKGIKDAAKIYEFVRAAREAMEPRK